MSHVKFWLSPPRDAAIGESGDGRSKHVSGFELDHDQSSEPRGLRCDEYRKILSEGGTNMGYIEGHDQTVMFSPRIECVGR